MYTINRLSSNGPWQSNGAHIPTDGLIQFNGISLLLLEGCDIIIRQHQPRRVTALHFQNLVVPHSSLVQIPGGKSHVHVHFSSFRETTVWHFCVLRDFVSNYVPIH
jgi:hypothetical protein